jgi:hypothetical protein
LIFITIPQLIAFALSLAWSYGVRKASNRTGTSGGLDWFNDPAALVGETTVRMTRASPPPEDVLARIAAGFPILTP